MQKAKFPKELPQFELICFRISLAKLAILSRRHIWGRSPAVNCHRRQCQTDSRWHPLTVYLTFNFSLSPRRYVCNPKRIIAS